MAVELSRAWLEGGGACVAPPLPPPTPTSPAHPTPPNPSPANRLQGTPLGNDAKKRLPEVSAEVERLAAEKAELERRMEEQVGAGVWVGAPAGWSRSVVWADCAS